MSEERCEKAAVSARTGLPRLGQVPSRELW